MCVLLDTLVDDSNNYFLHSQSRRDFEYWKYLQSFEWNSRVDHLNVVSVVVNSVHGARYHHILSGFELNTVLSKTEYMDSFIASET